MHGNEQEYLGRRKKGLALYGGVSAVMRKYGLNRVYYLIVDRIQKRISAHLVSNFQWIGQKQLVADTPQARPHQTSNA